MLHECADEHPDFRFDVEPGRAEELLSGLSRAADTPELFRDSFRPSLGRRHVTNYAQWRSKAEFDAFMSDPVARDRIDTDISNALSVTPIFYSLRATYGPLEPVSEYSTVSARERP